MHFQVFSLPFLFNLISIKNKEGFFGFFLNHRPPLGLQELSSSTQRGFFGRYVMKQEEELAIKVTKEVVRKIIEMGRLSVNVFDEVFKQVHKTVSESLQENSIKGGE
jgi:hypothetical protein